MNTMLRCTLLLAASTLTVGLLGCDGGDEVVEVTPRKQPANQVKIDPDAMPGQDGESGMTNVSGEAAKDIGK
ncbi:MAG: hypothetical protein CMJ54_06860 [Planctomycetaceae bacterium]|nr:hypothetical protein [Planctomycetaceae bacterium]